MIRYTKEEGMMSSTTAIKLAAIKSDMEHRGFEQMGDEFHKVVDKAGAMDHIWIHAYVRPGRVRIETSGGEIGNAAEIAETLRATFDKEVFEYWEKEVNDLFYNWIVNRPVAGDFEDSKIAMGLAASEISPDPLNHDDLGEAAVYLPGNMRLAGDLTLLEGNANLLKGEYASAFNKYYAAYLRPALARQSSVAGVLAVALRGEQEIWACVEDDLNEFLKRAETAMTESSPRGGNSAAVGVVVLTIVGAVFGVVGAIPTGGTSAVAVAAAFVAGGSSVAAAFIGEEETPAKTEIELAAGTPHGVVKKIKEGLVAFSEKIRAEEELIVRILKRVTAFVQSPAENSAFDLSLPRRSVSENVLDSKQLVVNSDDIAMIVARWLPSIAGDLRQSCRFADVNTRGIWHRAAGIGLYYDGPMNQFNDLQDLITSIMSNTARELNRVASILLRAARELGLTDEKLTRLYRQETRHINAINNNSQPQPAQH